MVTSSILPLVPGFVRSLTNRLWLPLSVEYSEDSLDDYPEETEAGADEESNEGNKLKIKLNLLLNYEIRSAKTLTAFNLSTV